MITSINHVSPKRIVNTSTTTHDNNENCGLSPQATCLLVNLPTRQLTQGISRISRPSLWGRGWGRGQLGAVGLLVCFAF